MNQKPINGRRGWTILLSSVGLSIGGAGSLPFLVPNLYQPVLRPDPFHGNQGRVLEKRIQAIEDKADAFLLNGPREVNRKLEALNEDVQRLLYIQNQMNIAQQVHFSNAKKE